MCIFTDSSDSSGKNVALLTMDSGPRSVDSEIVLLLLSFIDGRSIVEKSFVDDDGDDHHDHHQLPYHGIIYLTMWYIMMIYLPYICSTNIYCAFLELVLEHLCRKCGYKKVSGTVTGLNKLT